MIRFACPSCKAVLGMPEQSAGSVVACPKCGQHMRVPTPPSNPVNGGGIDSPSPSVPPDDRIEVGAADVIEESPATGETKEPEPNDAEVLKRPWWRRLTFAPKIHEPRPGEKDLIRIMWDSAKKEYDDLGGWKGCKSGEWLLVLIRKSFRNYWERGTAEYFQAKYHTTDPEKLAPKLISVAARNASILGGVTGAAMSANEVVAFFTGAELGLGLPANLAIAAASIAGEAIALTRFQLQLVAHIGKAYAVPLDPDDPEDILTILGYAMGGAAAEGLGKAGMKIGGNMAGRMAKTVFQKETLAICKRLAAKVGVKLLQRNIVKYTVPLASIAIGTGWNYLSTRAVGRLAVKHFTKRIADLSAGSNEDAPPPNAPPA